MSSTNNETHYFHADASAIGGTIQRPFAKNIPVQSPLSLPPVGGHASARSADFEFEGVIFAKATHAHVSGSFDTKGEPTTLVASAVEHLNLLHTVTADRLVAKISTQHPKPDSVGAQAEEAAPGGKEDDLPWKVPKVSFMGTHIENLRVAGSLLKVTLDLDLLRGDEHGPFPDTPHLKDLWTRIGRQYNDHRGFLLCSLVKKIEVIEGDFPLKTLPGKPNAFRVPDFGTVFLAELLVQYHSYRLIMMRIEFGCATTGAASFAAGQVNGGTH